MSFLRVVSRAWKRAGIALVAVSVLFVAGFLATQPYRTCCELALGEYLRPTTVDIMPIPSDCNKTEAPLSPLASRLVQEEEKYYDATLQQMIVYNCPATLSTLAPDFVQGGFPKTAQQKWFPVYIGCCTYRYRRHLTLLSASRNQDGSFKVSVAALIQSRWAYVHFLRWHCDEKLSAFL